MYVVTSYTIISLSHATVLQQQQRHPPQAICVCIAEAATQRGAQEGSFEGAFQYV